MLHVTPTPECPVALIARAAAVLLEEWRRCELADPARADGLAHRMAALEAIARDLTPHSAEGGAFLVLLARADVQCALSWADMGAADAPALRCAVETLERIAHGLLGVDRGPLVAYYASLDDAA